MKPSKMTHPSSNNSNNWSAPLGVQWIEEHLMNWFASNVVKKATCQKSALKPHRFFCSLTNTEDEEETPHAPDNHNAHDAHEDHEHKHEEQEATPAPQETEEATEYSVDPNGSQYNSGNDEFPLDMFNEYIKVEASDRDSIVVYICTAWEMSPSKMKDLMSLADTASTLSSWGI